MIEIRKMQLQEVDEVRNLAGDAVIEIDGILVDELKEVMVAVLDGEMVGAIIIKYSCSGEDKVGNYDGAFIHPEFYGKGIGTALYVGTAEYLWRMGYTMKEVIPKDHNVVSWKLCYK